MSEPEVSAQETTPTLRMGRAGEKPNFGHVLVCIDASPCATNLAPVAEVILAAPEQAIHSSIA